MILIIAIAIAAIFFMISPFKGLEAPAMRYMGIFIGMIIILIANALPDAVTIILALTALTVFRVDTQAAIWSSFGGTVVWLMIPAFAIGTAVAKTGLLSRMALWILKAFPSKYGGQILAQMISGIIMSPLIPSQNAKATIVTPYALSMCRELGYKKSSKPAVGIFLAMYTTAVTLGVCFLSGSINSFVIQGFLTDAQKAQFGWGNWFLGALPSLVVILVLLYLYLSRAYQPGKDEISFSDSQEYARKRLAEIGPLSKDEKVAIVVLAFTLIGWMTTKIHGLDASMVAMLAMIAFFVLGQFTMTDFQSKIPWSAVVFVGGINAVAGILSAVGLNKWIALNLQPLTNLFTTNVILVIIAVCVLAFLMRMAILSFVVVTAVVATIFTPICVAMGISPWIPLYAQIIIAMNWSLSFTNSQMITALAAGGGSDLLEYRDTQKASYVYSAIAFAGILVSIPFWKMMGLW